MSQFLKIFAALLIITALPGLLKSQINPPVLEKLSILNDFGDVIITWQMSSTPGVEGYIIYEYIGDFHGINTIQVGVVDHSQTSYVVTATEANQKSVAFVLAAFFINSGDTIRSALTPPQRTIFLNTHWNPCITTNTLNWNAYIGWNDLSGYQVSWYIQGNGLITNEPFLDASHTTFYHLNPPLNNEICYFITAFNQQGHQSVSNKFCIPTSVKVPPSYIHASYATVNSDNKIEISFHPDPLAQTDMYEIYRSFNITGPFNLLSRISHFPASRISYTDTMATPGKVQYYKLISLNQCELSSVESNIASNISLQLNQNNEINYLNWNAYQTWLGGVQEYQIYRIIETGFPELIGTVISASSGFSDNPSTVIQPGLSGEFCYFVKALEGNTNPFGVKSNSTSNIACAVSEPEIFIANAFTPDGDGKNDFFITFFTFLPVRYHLIIYDRWANVIFESKNVNTHWDGTIRGGRKAPEGLYTYLLLVETKTGKKIKKTGQIALIYP